MNAVDTNVLLYAVDEDEPAKRKQARDLLRQLGHTDEPLLPWQVLGEFLASLRRWEQQRGYDPRRTRRYFPLITSRMRIVYPNLAAADRSFELRERYSLSHRDSMLLAACAIAGVDTLYSEDMDDGMTYGTVKVVNPFASPQHSVPPAAGSTLGYVESLPLPAQYSRHRQANHAHRERQTA